MIRARSIFSRLRLPMLPGKQQARSPNTKTYRSTRQGFLRRADSALPTPTVDVAAIFGQVKQGKLNPVTALMTLRGQGAGINVLLAAMNENHAVVKYGGQTVIATITGDDIGFMKVEDFHRVFANLVVFGPERIKVSKRWFEWTD